MTAPDANPPAGSGAGASLVVLVPTYNRSIYLRKNLRLLLRDIAALPAPGRVSILVSDNCSTDDTQEMVAAIRREPGGERVAYLRNDRNLGLEANVVAALRGAAADFVMFLGDDDILPNRYLARVLAAIDSDATLACVVPGNMASYESGRFTLSRLAGFAERRYAPGFWTVARLSHYTNQLSGLVFRRAGLLESYLRDASLRNIYPFHHFGIFSMNRGTTHFLASAKVAVWSSAAKDWGYDDSGLLREIFKNYNCFYGRNGLRVFLLQLIVMLRQPWRLRPERPRSYGRAVRQLWGSPEAAWLTKLALFALPFYVPFYVVVTKWRKVEFEARPYFGD